MDGTRGYHTKWVSLKEKDKYHQIYFYRGFPGSSAGKESAYNAADPGSVPGSGRFPWRRDTLPTRVFLGFPAGSDGKGSACNAGELGLIPGLGRFPGGGNGNPLQYSCLENPHGQRSLVGYSPWGLTESDTTKATKQQQQHANGWGIDLLFSSDWSVISSQPILPVII